MNRDVVAWYCDQSAAYLGILVSIILFVIIINKLRFSDENDAKYSKSLKIWICSLYISCILLLIALPIFPSNNQFNICKTIHFFSVPFGAAYHISVLNLFVERLYISFKNSVFALSKRFNYGIRIIYVIIWIIIVIAASIILDPSPYDVYQQQIDYNGHGVTCSALGAGKHSIAVLVTTSFIGITILISNIILWSLFIYKLYNLIKGTKRSENKTQNHDLVVLMEEQTTIVALAVFSTVILYMLQSVNVLGQFFITLDFIITPFIIFLSFPFNRYYFELMKCDKLAMCCCKAFESKFMRILTRDESKLAQIVETNSKSSACNEKADIASV